MVDIKEVVVPPIWEKIDIFLKLHDHAGNPLSGMGYVIYTDHEERRGKTTEEGVIEEKGVKGKDYRIELENGSMVAFEEGGAEDAETDEISLDDLPEEEAGLDDGMEYSVIDEDLTEETPVEIDEESDIEEDEE